MIFKKMFGAVRAQLNKLANYFWEADPIAQMQYEYDSAVEQLKEGRIGLEQYRGLVERVGRQVKEGETHVAKLQSQAKAYLKARRARDRGQVRPRATEGQGTAEPEQGAAGDARDRVPEQPQEDPARQQEAG